MTLRIVPYYAALLGLLFLLLSANVIRLRSARGIPLGAGADVGLERRIRVHANFAEYCPFTLLLLSMAELRGASGLLLNLLCLCLVAGRVVHAWAVSQINEDGRLRIAGMAGTLTALGGAVLLILVS